MNYLPDAASTPAYPSNTGLVPEQGAEAPTGTTQTKAERLQGRRDYKVRQLTAGAGYVGNDRTDETQIVDGHAEWMENKILNSYTPAELDNINQSLLLEYEVYDTDEGYMQADADGQLVPFKGDPSTLGVFYRAKTAEGHDKIGVTFELNPEDRFKNQSLDVSPLGVDVSQGIEKHILPYDVATLKEAINHGNESMLQKRLLRRKPDVDWDTFKKVQKLYGTGSTEMYRAEEPGGSPDIDGILASLQGTESSNNPEAFRTNKDGRSYGGLLQMGDARLKDYARATGTKPIAAEDIQYLTTDEQAVINDWHIRDLVDHAISTGAEGRTFNGVKATLGGLVAISHLGGRTGLQNFIDSDGKADKRDEEGTSMTGYLQKHAGVGRTPAPEVPSEPIDPNLMSAFNERFRPSTGGQLTEEELADMFNARIENERMENRGRASNTVRGFASMATREVLVNTADLAAEIVGSDIGDAEYKKKLTDKFFGYNPKYSEEAMRRIEGNVSNLMAAAKGDKDFDWRDISEILIESATTYELLGESFGALVGITLGFGKFTKVGGAILDVEKAYKAGKISKEVAKAKVKDHKQAASLLDRAKTVTANHGVSAVVVAGRSNDTLEAFMEHNNGEYDMADLTRIVLAESLAASMDKLSASLILKDLPGIRNFKSPMNVKTMKEAVKEVGDNPVLNYAVLSAASKGLKALQPVGKLGVSSAGEGVTEYMQTMLEIFGEKYGTDEYGSNLYDLLMSDESQLQAFTGMAVGTAMGGQMEVMGMAARGVKTLGSTASEKLSSKPEAAEPEDRTERIQKASQVYRDTSSEFVSMFDRMEEGELTSEDFIAAVDKLSEVRKVAEELRGIENPELAEHRAILTKMRDITNSQMENSDEGNLDMSFDNAEVAARSVEAFAENLLDKYEGTLPEDVEVKLRNFAKTNKAPEDLVERLIKTYASVQQEATVESRGTVARRERLDEILESGTATSEAVQKQYDEARTFFSATLDSISKLEEGIAKAKLRAVTENNKLSFNFKNSSITVKTEYMTHPESGKKGEAFDITLRKVDKKWVPDLFEANKRLDSKRARSKELSNLLDTFHDKAEHFLDPDKSLATGGYVVTTKAGDLSKSEKEEVDYVKGIKKAAGKAVNKVILGDKTAKFWGKSTIRSRVNSPLTNSLTTRGKDYSDSDVVYLHAPGFLDGKKDPETGKVVKKHLDLHGKNSPAAKELSAAMEAGATIAFANDHKRNSAKPKAGGRGHGNALHAFMTARGYIPLGVDSVERNIYVPDTEASTLALAVKKEAATEAAAVSKKEKADKEKLSALAVQIEAHRIEGEEVPADLQEAYDKSVEAVKPYFEATALRQAIAKTKEAFRDEEFVEQELESQIDIDENSGTGSEVELSDSADLDDAVEVPKIDSLTHIDDAIKDMDVSEKVEENIEKFRKSSIKSAANKARVSIKKAEKAGVNLEVSKSIRTLVKEYDRIETLKGVQGTKLLEAWKDASEKGLTGKAFEEAMQKAAQDVGAEIDLGSLSRGILESSVGSLNKDDVYFIKTDGFDKSGNPSVTHQVQFGPTRKVKDKKTGELVDKPYKVGETTSVYGQKGKILAVNRYSTNPNDYIEVKKKTALNSIDVNTMPEVFRATASKTLETLKSILVPLEDVEKGIGKTKLKEDSKSGYKAVHSPSRTLLFDKNGKINPNIAAAMAVAIRDAISTERQKLLKGPKDIKVAAAMLGMREEDVTPEQMQFVADHGMYGKTIGDTIAKNMLSALGLGAKSNSKQNLGQYQRLVADLGNVALRVAESEGLLKADTVKSNDLAAIRNDGEIMLGEKASSTTLFISIPHTSKKVEGTSYKMNAPTKELEGVIDEFKEMDTLLPDPANRSQGAFYGKPPSQKYQERALSSIRNDEVGGQIPKEAKTALTSYMNTSYKMNIKEAKKILDLIDDPATSLATKKLLGYIEVSGDNPEYEALLFDKKAIQESINRDIERSIEHLRKAYDRIEAGAPNQMYFGFYYSKNHRYNLDSNEINPQTDKLHRFLFQPEAHDVTYDVDPSRNTFNFRYSKDGEDEDIDSSLFVRAALAQAVGVGIDKTATEEIIEVGNYLLNLTVKDVGEIESRYLRDGKISIMTDSRGDDGEVFVDVKPDHPSHVFQALAFLSEYAAAKEASGGKHFEFSSSLSAEFDALTSGFSNKVQQFGTLGSPEALIRHSNRVGVINPDGNDDTNSKLANGSGINDILSDPKRMDSYKSLADKVIRAVTEKLNGSVSPEDMEFFGAIKSVLPGGDLVGLTDFAVTSALRNLFKPSFMIFNYSASIERIVENLSKEMVEQALAEIASKDLDAAENQSIREAADTIAKKLASKGDEPKTGIELQDMLKSKSLKDIKVSVGKLDENGVEKGFTAKPLAEFLAEKYIKPTYGTSVKEAFDEEFSDFIEIQDATNDMFKQAYVVFNQALLNKIKAHTEKDDSVEITPELLMSFIDDLREVFPVIAGPLSNALSEGVHVYDTAVRSPNSVLSTSSSPQAQFKGDDGKTVQRKTNPLMRAIVAAANAGAVLPFHAIDGAQMARATNAFMKEWLEGSNIKGSEATSTTSSASVGAGILPVHDAIIAPLPFSDIVPYLYNKVTVGINTQYSIMREIMSMAERTNAAISDGDSKHYIDPKTLAVPKGLKIGSTSENYEPRKALGKVLADAKAEVKRIKKERDADEVKEKGSGAKYREELTKAEQAEALAADALGFKATFDLSMSRLRIIANKVETGRQLVFKKGSSTGAAGTKVGVLVGFKGSIYEHADDAPSRPDSDYLDAFHDLYYGTRKAGPRNPTVYSGQKGSDRTQVKYPTSKKPDDKEFKEGLEKYRTRSSVANKVIGERITRKGKDEAYTAFVEINDTLEDYVEGDTVMLILPEDINDVDWDLYKTGKVQIAMAVNEALGEGATILLETKGQMVAGTTSLSHVFKRGEDNFSENLDRNLFTEGAMRIGDVTYLTLEPTKAKEAPSPGTVVTEVEAYKSMAKVSKGVIGVTEGHGEFGLNEEYKNTISNNALPADALAEGGIVMLAYPEEYNFDKDKDSQYKNDGIPYDITLEVGYAIDAAAARGVSILVGKRDYVENSTNRLGTYINELIEPQVFERSYFPIDGVDYVIASPRKPENGKPENDVDSDKQDSNSGLPTESTDLAEVGEKVDDQTAQCKYKDIPSFDT